MVTHTREILNTAAADKHNAVLLKVMADTGNVRRNLDAVGKSDPGDFTKSRVRFLRGLGLNHRAHAPLLRGILVDERTLLGIVALQKRRGLGLLLYRLSACADQLIKGWNIAPP